MSTVTSLDFCMKNSGYEQNYTGQWSKINQSSAHVDGTPVLLINKSRTSKPMVFQWLYRENLMYKLSNYNMDRNSIAKLPVYLSVVSLVLAVESNLH